VALDNIGVGVVGGAGAGAAIGTTQQRRDRTDRAD
jgi:hypothetical protein